MALVPSKKINMLDGEKLDFVGVHDFDEWYKYLYRWMEWHKFSVVTEKKYKEQRNVQPDGTMSKNVEIVWEASRSIDEYTQIGMEARIFCVNQKDIEVVRDGVKANWQTGEIILYVWAWFQLDKANWFQSPAMGFLKKFYEKYLYRDMIEQLKKDVWKMGWEFFNDAKNLLHLYTFETQPSNISKKGVGGGSRGF
jgi:hypothetical protein